MMESGPTLEQRLDAAAEQYREKTLIWVPGDPRWDQISEAQRAYYRKECQTVCRAFAPEHFKDISKEDC